MRIILSAVLVMAALGCQSASKPRGPVTASAKVKEFLKDDMMAVVSAPDSVQAMLVEPREGSTGADVIEGHKILSKPAALNADQSAALTAMILDEASYDFVHVKRHPMDPSIVFQFKKGKDTVNVLVSFYGNLWQFSGFGRSAIEDNDAVRKDLLAIAKKLFPSDKEIQSFQESQPVEGK